MTIDTTIIDSVLDTITNGEILVESQYRDSTINEFFCEEQERCCCKNENNQPNGWLQLLLPLVVTLAVVFIEKWVAQGFNRCNERKKRDKFRHSVLDWIKLIMPVEKGLSESLKQLSMDIENSDNMQPEPFAMPITIPDKMATLTAETMLDAFLSDDMGDKEQASRHVYNIISQLEYLSKMQAEISKAYDTYNKQAYDCCKQWNDTLPSFNAWTQQLPRDGQLHDFVKKWAAGNIGKKDSIRNHSELINNIYGFISKDDPILPIIAKMNIVIKQRESLSVGYKKVFNGLSTNIIIALNSLNDACEFFSKRKKR